jgi:pilus assembly protein Flp/PilA
LPRRSAPRNDGTPLLSTTPKLSRRSGLAPEPSPLVNLLYSIWARVNQRNNPMRAFLANLLYDESGVTAVEYALVAALIAVAAVIILGNIGTNLTSVFSKTASKL